MSVARHSIYNFVGGAIPILLSLVTVPLYLRTVGLDRYGILSICWLLVGYFGLFEFGLGTATAQQLSAHGKRAGQHYADILSSGILLALVFGSAGAVIFWIVAEPALLAMHDLAPGFRREIEAGIGWLALCIPLSTLSSVLGARLQSERRFLQLNGVMLISTALATLTPLMIALTWSTKLPELLAGVVFAKLVSTVAFYFVGSRNSQMGRLGLPSIAQCKRMLRFGGWITAGSALSQSLLALEKLVLGWKLGSASVAVYMIPYSLATRLLIVPQSLTSALFPVVAATAKQDQQALGKRSFKILLGLMTPVIVAGLTGLPLFLTVWLGPQMAQRAAPVGAIILLGIWFNLGSHIVLTRFQATGRPDLVAKITLLQLAPYVALLLMLIKRFGLLGAAWAWTIRVIIELVIYLVASNTFRELVPWIAPRAGIVGLAFALDWMTGPTDWFRLLAGSALFLLSSWWAWTIVDRSRLAVEADVPENADAIKVAPNQGEG